jgi:pheromone a factor receptor
MVWHVVVQGHRYDIVERVGCVPTVYWSYPAIFLIGIWPVILNAIAAIYAGMSNRPSTLLLVGADTSDRTGLATRLFILRRAQFSKILASSQSAITTSRFLRLIGLSTVVIAIDLPLVTYLLINNIIFQKIRPYTSWELVHYDFYNVLTATAESWNMIPTERRVLTELSWWISPVACTLFFIFFGIGEESLTAYRRWRSWVVKLLPGSIFRQKSGKE